MHSGILYTVEVERETYGQASRRKADRPGHPFHGLIGAELVALPFRAGEYMVGVWVWCAVCFGARLNQLLIPVH